MPGAPPMTLLRGRVSARIRADEGGVLDELLVEGRPVLARTPWSEDVTPAPQAPVSEGDWVTRWRGGWQLCFPSSGQPDGRAPTPQGFHGIASQGPWTLVDAGPDRLTLRWDDADGLRAERVWHLTDDGIAAATSTINGGAGSRRIAIAEHLVLGGDVLAPVLAGAALALDVPEGTRLAPLDYAGRPAGDPVAWPGDPEARWGTVDGATPARVVALLGRSGDTDAERQVTARGPHVHATISWRGLPHALLWEELAASLDAPWNGAVVALGIEPTSTPHGAGTAADLGIVTLEAGAQLHWRTALAVRWTSAGRR